LNTSSAQSSAFGQGGDDGCAEELVGFGVVAADLEHLGSKFAVFAAFTV